MFPSLTWSSRLLLPRLWLQKARRLRRYQHLKLRQSSRDLITLLRPIGTSCLTSVTPRIASSCAVRPRPDHWPHKPPPSLEAWFCFIVVRLFRHSSLHPAAGGPERRVRLACMPTATPTFRSGARPACTTRRNGRRESAYLTQRRYSRAVGRNRHACRLTANWAGKQYPATTTPSRLRAKLLFLRASAPATELDCASLAPPHWLGRDGAIPVSWLITSLARPLETNQIIDAIEG